LGAQPKTLPFAYFYDEIGSVLFEQICRLPEYYLTRTEDAILREHSGTIVDGWSEPPTLIELGSGSAEKTRRLIAALLARHGRLHYVPIDVSATALETSARQLARAFPNLRVSGFLGDYHEGLSSVFRRIPGPRLVAFLGSSLGNYDLAGAHALLDQIARRMEADDRFLLGTDLVKDTSLLEAAYDDAQGVTARFNRNLLVRINRELRADFSIERFRHRARFNEELARVEMHLDSLCRQIVTIPGAGIVVEFEKGESIHTENSHKYTVDSLQALGDRTGFVEETAWSDPRGWFRLQRWRTAL
jgi:dimethylhistidine N-methyltransferase